MAWQDRLRTAAYTSPGGARIEFAYEDVSAKFDKKTTGFEFPDADGTYVQDSGHTGRKMPLRLFFWGSDYDTEAAAFDAALRERGAGTLDHPSYGTVDVVPFGTVTRRDDLVTAANQAIFEVVFWETTGLAYPTARLDPVSSAVDAVAQYNIAAAAEFADETDLLAQVAQSTLTGGYQALLGSVSGGLRAVAAVQADVLAQFDAVVESVNSGIDILIADPLTLASQTLIAIQSPARALAAITDRLQAYGDLASSIFSSSPPDNNTYRAANLYASTHVTGSVLSVVNNQFETQIDAISAADAVLQQFADLVVWQDDTRAELGLVDQGVAYQALQTAVATAVGFLVETSFSLKQERQVVLGSARTIIDLAAELYGAVDSELDFLIDSNNLTGSEILELPRGREIVYYI